MKKLTRLLALALCLVMTLSVLGVTAMAADDDAGKTDKDKTPTATVTCRAIFYKDTCRSAAADCKDVKLTITEPVTLDGGAIFGYFPTRLGRLYEYVGAGTDAELDPKEAKEFYVEFYFIPHIHSYRIGYNRTHHWEACRCGSTLSYDPHVDPATDEDSICTCGYKFSSNATLNTLNLTDVLLQDRFNPEQTVYVGNVYTYQPITSTTVTAHANDFYATVEAPATAEIKEGMNVIEVKVTAEDKKTTRTYTVYASRGSKVDGVLVSNTMTADGEFATCITQPAVDRFCIATLGITSEALAEKMAFQADSCESKRIIVEPTYNIWSVHTIHVQMSAAVLEKLSQSEADLVIKSHIGNIVVPNSELASLAKDGEIVDFCLLKNEDSTVSINLRIGDERVENAKLSLEPAEK